MDINPIDGPGGHPIPQTFESRTDEGGAAVTLINKTVVWFEIKTVLYNLRFQSRYLTGNGSLLSLLFRGDTSVEGNTECRHAHLLLTSLTLLDLLLCGAILSSVGGVKRRSTRGSSRSKASASHRPLYRVVSWLPPPPPSRKQPLEGLGQPSPAIPGGLMARPHPQGRSCLVAPSHRHLHQPRDPHPEADAPSTAPRQSHRRSATAAARAAPSPRGQRVILQDCWRGESAALRQAQECGIGCWPSTAKVRQG